MTHIENIPHVLQFGITHSSSPNSNINFKPIGDSSLIATRNSYILNNGRCLGDYIPFYFGTRTPMLYVMQKGFNMVNPTPAEDIVYCVSSVQKIIDLNLDFIFTNGHAVDRFSSQYTNLDIHNIEELIDWDAVKAKYWHNEQDLDLKRRKEAEFLILGDIAVNAVSGFVVYNEQARSKIQGFGVEATKIHVSPNYYF